MSPAFVRKGLHVDTSDTTFAPAEFKRDLNGSPLQYQSKEVAVKPSILEKGFATNTDFFRLSDGFKRVFTNDNAERGMRIPVVGYTGHRKGERAENVFAKNFRETSFESVRNLRCHKNSTRSGFMHS